MKHMKKCIIQDNEKKNIIWPHLCIGAPIYGSWTASCDIGWPFLAT